MEHNAQDPNNRNDELSLAASLTIVEQLAKPLQERTGSDERRKESGTWSIGPGDLLFDLPGSAPDISSVLPDSPELGPGFANSLPIDLGAAHEMLGSGLGATSETLGSGLVAASEGLGSSLVATLEVLGEGLGGLFDALGHLDFFLDADFF